MRKRNLTLTVAAIALLWMGAARAEPTGPTDICQQGMQTALGVLDNCLQGAPGRVAECQREFDATLAKIEAEALREGRSCRYTDNGDGTVTDCDTRLMWEMKTGTVGGGADPSDPHNVNNTYTWSNTGSAPDGMVFTTFLPFLNGQIPGSSCFASRCDWRLPSVEELAGIIDRGVPDCSVGSHNPCIAPIFGPTQSGLYWTDSTLPPAPDFVWGVQFSDHGNTGLTKKVLSFSVRAVRTCAPAPGPECTCE